MFALLLKYDWTAALLETIINHSNYANLYFETVQKPILLAWHACAQNIKID